MAFEVIECLKAAAPAAPKVPPFGVQITARKLGSRSGKDVRYLRLQIGAKLASGISLTKEQQGVILLFGTDEDAGKVRVVAPQVGGGFNAKRDKAGNYTVTINAATADGLFTLSFPPHIVAKCEPIRPTNGQSPHFVFMASAEMLSIED